MKCYTHNIEYSGSCPRCEQERHHKAVEDGQNRQIAAEEARARAARFEKEQQEREAARSAIKNIFIQFIPIVHENFGDDFLARHYLRLTLDADELSGGNLISELIRDVLAQDMSEENKKFIKLQESLKRAIVQKSDESYEIIKKLSDKQDSIKSTIGLASYFVAFIVAFIWGIVNSSGSFIIFQVVIWVMALLFGWLGGFLLAQAISKITLGDKGKPEWFLDRYDDVELQLGRFTPWYSNQKNISKQLTESISKGTPFVMALMKKWESSDDDTLRAIEVDINKVESFNYKFPDNYSEITEEKNNFYRSTHANLKIGASPALFCEECGAKQPVPKSKFCGNCGNIIN